MTANRSADVWSLVSLLSIPLLIAVGQVLFKQASRTGGLLGGHPLLGMLSNPFLIAALALYLTASLWWVAVLRTTSLSHAYAFMALSFLYVPVMSWLVLGERFGWRTAVAFVLILAGIALAATDTPNEAAGASALNEPT